MDPRDRLPPFVNGVECAVCGRIVPRNGIRVLASRDDLTFVELSCADCRSDSLGIVVATDSWLDGPDGEPASPYGEFQPADDERFREALPIDADDVARFRSVLARHGVSAFVDPAAAPGDDGAGR
jgi:hypothetical protein